MTRLGVNVDHVATLRQARRTYEPDPITAASLAEQGGADVITIHLREDRRHIQERDLKLLRQVVFTKLNLELSAAPEIVKIALAERPDQVTFVPERRQEITTEGGLDVASQKKGLIPIVKRFKTQGIIVSLFIDPEEEQIMASKEVGADLVELHTGAYANAKRESQQKDMLERLRAGAQLSRQIGLGVNAGHGLNYKNVGPVVEELAAEELHIGHSIISRAIFVGIKRAVEEMKEVIYRHCLLANARK
ncbi:MAG TPA: pyridoxine 5'-phosphate synthase [Candidatus Hypogeohydataceae bacterium YC38]|nr:pyridoxine 5'-phosphate synthase [Candidatus Brocadiales bacterium]